MGRPSDWEVLDLPGDPVPGDPPAVESVARRWSRVADDAESARARVVSLLGDQAVMQWVGRAGDAFRRHSSKLPDQLAKCAESYRLASAALGAWSGQLAFFGTPPILDVRSESCPAMRRDRDPISSRPVPTPWSLRTA